jgi:origin recognition complex subunit 4
VIFILEEIDFYIENSKQNLLYKILDMLQYCSIPFVFLATSQKVDIVDSFEKRIKSRFSHRQILFYHEEFSHFEDAVHKMVEEEFKQPLLVA